MSRRENSISGVGGKVAWVIKFNSIYFHSIANEITKWKTNFRENFPDTGFFMLSHRSANNFKSARNWPRDMNAEKWQQIKYLNFSF